MSARSKLETFEEVYNRKLTAAEAYANRPRKWMLYTLIVLIIAVMVSWSSSSIQFNGMTTTGSEVAKGVLHGVFNPDTQLLFGTGDTDVPYLLLQTVAIAVLGTLFGAAGTIASALHAMTAPAAAVGFGASFLLGFLAIQGIALLTALLERLPIKKMWKSVLLFPVFMLPMSYLALVALFRPQAEWKPIAHTDRRTISDVSRSGG